MGGFRLTSPQDPSGRLMAQAAIANHSTFYETKATDNGIDSYLGKKHPPHTHPHTHAHTHTCAYTHMRIHTVLMRLFSIPSGYKIASGYFLSELVQREFIFSVLTLLYMQYQQYMQQNGQCCSLLHT